MRGAIRHMNFTLAIALAFAAVFARAELPPLVGDGVHDDTAAIQARLDSGATLVYLPSPKKEYLISKALLLSSNCELRLDRNTVVRLAPGSRCSMVENRHYETGDRNLAVTGGRWEYDNVLQKGNLFVAKGVNMMDATAYSRANDRGCVFIFDRVDGLALRGVTFCNPVTYSCQLVRVSNFTVEDIAFDFTKWNPLPINMDGIHLDGGCHHGRISNLRGTCFDDMVALNANDGIDTPYQGPISDIDIDGLYSDFTHRGVRILSAGAPIRRVTVRNVHIKTYRNAVAITHFFRDRKTRGDFDEIAIRDIQSSATYEPDALYHDKTAWPIIWVESMCDVGHLVIDNVSRTETCRAVHPTIGIDPDATVEHLVIRDCRQVNETKDDMVFLTVHGKVENLELGEVSLKSAPGAGHNVLRDDTADCGRFFPRFTPNVRPGYTPPAKDK